MTSRQQHRPQPDANLTPNVPVCGTDSLPLPDAGEAHSGEPVPTVRGEGAARKGLVREASGGWPVPMASKEQVRHQRPAKACLPDKTDPTSGWVSQGSPLP